MPRPEFTLLVDPPAGDPEHLIAEIKLPGVVRDTHTHTVISLLLLYTLYKLFTLFISVLSSFISNTLDGSNSPKGYPPLSCLAVRHFQLAGMIG